MHRSLSLANVCACLVFALIAVVPFEPWGRRAGSPCSFEALVQSEQSGLAQLYFDVGRGLNEEDSSIQPVIAGRPSLLRFPLPSGTIRALRFDPLDRPARMVVSGARIADGSGRIVASFAPPQFQKGNQIESLRVLGQELALETAPYGFDPQLVIELAKPITIARPMWWKPVALLFASLIGCLLAAGWATRSGSVRLAERAGSLWKGAQEHPGRAVLAVALAATLAANYPVILAGRSVVSPNLGVALLYGQNPWIPGFQSAEVGDPHKADVGALLWHHLPLSMIERRAILRDGEVPLWNRYDSAGSPLLGQGQSGFGDPLNLLAILSNGAFWAWDLKFLLAKLILAWGIGLCAWRSSRHLAASLLVTGSAAFLGFFVYRINHPAIFSLCYSPWILYCWLRCVDAGSARGAALWLIGLMGANWAEMNSGTAKEAYTLILTMNFAGLCTLLGCGRPPSWKARMLGGALAAGAIFAMVSSPVWLTFYRALRHSYTSYNSPLAFQLQPGMLLGLFDEAFYRPFQIESGVVNPSCNVFVLIGLLWAVVRWRSVAADRRSVALLISSLPALALAFGVVPPGLIARIPLLGSILHVDNTFSCALIVICCVLAATGWREALGSLGSTEGGREATAVVSLLVALLAACLGTAQAIVRSAYWDRTWGKLIEVQPFIYGYGLSLVAAAAALLWVLHSGRRRGSLTPAMLICAALAFAAFHWREGLHVGVGFSDYVVKPTRRVDLQAASPTVEAILARRDSPFRVIGFHNDFLPGWSAAYDLEGISGPDALVNPYYRELMDAAGFARVWDWRYIVETRDLPRLKPLLDFLNVRFYLSYCRDPREAEEDLKRFASLDMDSFESASSWPRAFFTDSVALYDDPAQLCSWIRSGDGRPFAGIQRSEWSRLSPPPQVSGELGTRKVRPAEDYRLTTNTTSFTVSATGPGFIVLGEAYEPGNFHATVNGRPVPYVRINHAFKGVYVDSAGTYRVSFAYWPRGFSTELVLSAVGLGLLAAGLAAAIFLLKPAPDPRPDPV
ncbi:MAG TPA: hypothetical protein VKG78_06730 [Opitutaceae bacterium]|nr:hypothetical protein [Opitutaceae bacterium]